MGPPTTVLKRKHSLRGVNLLELVRRMRRSTDMPASLARWNSTKPMEDFPLRELGNFFSELTGDTLEGVLELCNREVNITNARLLTHQAIILANEVGQPSGQDLVSPQVTVDAQEETSPPPPKKTKGEDHNDLLLRVRQLEDSISPSHGQHIVVELKEKVRALCLQNNPSGQLILLTVDELAKTARRMSHEDVETYEELSRQLMRHQDRINVSSFCLSVLGGKASDTITKALNKCIKEKQLEDQSKEKIVDGKAQMSPNLYPPFANVYNPAPPAAYQYPPQPAYPQYGWVRPRGGGRFNYRPKGACLFCEATDHFIRDCPKMKDAKKSQYK